MSRQLIKRENKEMETLKKDRCNIVIILLLLVGITFTLFATFTMARYTNTSENSDTARVAQFAVSQPTKQTDNDLALNLTDTSTTYTFTVSNVRDTSVVNEVKTSYDVVVTFPEALASYVTLTMTNDNGDTDKAAVASTDNKTFTFKEMGTFEANTARTDTLTLKFTLDSSTTESIAKTWSGIDITVKAQQVD